MRIAVIGSGIAGLTVSRLLIEAGHVVTLFERHDSPGMDAHSINIDLDGASVRADVPSRMFNEQLWPTLTRFYKRAGIDGVPVDLTQAFAQLGGDSYLNLNRANRPSGNSLALLKPRIRKLLQQAIRLRDNGMKDIDNGLDASLTFAEYLSQNDYDPSFVREFLYPTLSSTVFTCSYESLDNYPATVLLSTLAKLNEAPILQRANGGSRNVVTRLLESIDDARFSHTVESVGIAKSGNSHEAQVEVSFVAGSNGSRSSQSFDHVVMATQANTARKLLADLNMEEDKTLGSFKYESIPIFVHTDPTLMPSERKQWATFNMISQPDQSAAMCSVWLNRFHDDWKLQTAVFQSINAFVEPRSDSVLASCTMQRPVVDEHSLKAVQQIGEWHQQAGRRIWFCGSYASAGTPLLESGVVSAEAVVARL